MTINDYLKIYNFNFFENNEMIEFVRSVEKLPKDMIITKPYNCKFSNNDIYDSINKRIPIYYGTPVENLYHYNKKHYKQKFGLKYAICGKAYLKDTSYFYAIHTWGINLESPDTIDYKNIIDDKNNINFEMYRTEIIKMLECIIKSKDYYNLSKIYMPMVGQGEYLSFISYKKKLKCINILFEEIYNIDMNIIVVIPKKNALNKKIYEKYKDYIKIGTIFEPQSDIDGDYGIVNAWDSDSFIGNGGCQDNTIDGYFVSGHGINKNLQNSSILHNHLLNDLNEIKII